MSRRTIAYRERLKEIVLPALQSGQSPKIVLRLVGDFLVGPEQREGLEIFRMAETEIVCLLSSKKKRIDIGRFETDLKEILSKREFATTKSRELRRWLVVVWCYALDLPQPYKAVSDPTGIKLCREWLRCFQASTVSKCELRNRALTLVPLSKEGTGDPQRAAYWLSLAAMKKDREALFLLGEWRRLGIVSSERSAPDFWLKPLKQACFLGSGEAALELAKYRVTQGDLDKAAALADKALRRGAKDHPEFGLAPMRDAGEIYDRCALALPQDSERSITYLKKAVDCHCPNACFRLGMLYLQGNYIAANRKLAAKYLCEAADLGYRKAAYEAGLLLLVRQEWAEAEKYFEKVQAEDATYEQKISNAYFEMSEKAGSEQNKFYCLHKAADLGHTEAQYRYGCACEKTFAFEAAAKMYTAAYKKGHKDACLALSRCYRKGIGVWRSRSYARMLKKEAKRS